MSKINETKKWVDEYEAQKNEATKLKNEVVRLQDEITRQIDQNHVRRQNIERDANARLAAVSAELVQANGMRNSAIILTLDCIFLSLCYTILSGFFLL